MVEKLGGNDPCPCGSGRRFQTLLPPEGHLRRGTGRLLRPGLASAQQAPGWGRR
ncbi:SEC-C metal-binding domain-containing protein [Nocardia sp. IFM 10818]